MKKKCLNSKCNKDYEVKNEKTDLGFCCFECWEEVNCGEPEKVEFPEFVLE